MRDKKILGIDPGFGIIGYGLIEVQNKTESFVDCGVIKTDPKRPLSERLLEIYEGICHLIDSLKPDEVAIEELYFFRNVTTAIFVGEARGVIILAFEQKKIPIYEYTPMEVKMAVTGYGKATKRQVQEMVRIMMKMENIPRPDDAADALAIALCHAHQIRL
ncbi:crossover junction endodeoxyribonuclease RuvC [Athalassotoga saccharophila]|uniref:crossover junction endodeoxyribonuclease RuvC n=1 Tax=Athalassotoga saccharophila TaxID=1441386 RepID=UPI001379A2B2|nr:crossover junction endodeoxyribonuclease RuvC [Athalassotoga saccharophila]BBJ28964.1 Crossover junction endodeoxyribonuclease RuvC [Athalassotoga saccharophila]